MLDKNNFSDKTAKDLKVKVLDCTIRDGGYLNNWNFSKKLVREAYRAVSKAGVDIMEIGFRRNDKFFEEGAGPWCFSTEDDIREVLGGIDGAKISVMVDVGRAESSDFLESKLSKIEMVRVAAHKDRIKEALRLLDSLKNKGYQVSLQAMGFTTYSELEKKNLIGDVRNSNIDYLYIADSYGSMYPDSIEKIFSPFRELKGIKMGFHPHNNLQMAFANTLQAIRCGTDIVDASIYGMGRGSGNLPLETIIAYLQLSSDSSKYNVIPVLSCIDRYFVDIKKEIPWGYQLPYMISGVMGCHPSYAKKFIDLREYTVEEVWKALEFIKGLNPVGFDAEVIKKIIHTGLIGHKVNVKPQGAKKVLDSSPAEPAAKRPVYIDRHKGKDFLILANGPTLKEYSKETSEFIDKYKPIVLGANYIGSLFKPRYHVFNNKKRFIEYIDTVDKESSLLIGRSLPDELIREYTGRDYETLEYADLLDADFDIVNGVIQTNCRSVSVLLLGAAITMGAERIFAVGLDGYLTAGDKGGYHFYNETGEPENRKIIVERHHWNEHFIRQIDEYFCNMGKEGIHILTPTDYKAFHKSFHNYIGEKVS